MDWSKVTHFTQDEFDDPTEKGSGKNMVEELIFMLDAARELAGVPFIIESGYRTAAHNRAVGGAPSSAHLTGEAVDIKVQNSAVRWNILVALLAVGFDRIEIKPGDLHVDVAKDVLHPRERIMVIDTKTGLLR